MSHSEYPILIVEDTLDYAKLTQITLKRFGYDAVHVPDAERALAFMEEQRPALILLDLNLPDMSGWQLLDRIIALYGSGTIPVIVTTAYSDSANRVVGKLQDVQQYLVKPFTPKDLREAVEYALGRESA